MTITFTDPSGLILTYSDVSDEKIDKIMAILKKEAKPKKARKPKPTFTDLGNTDDFENDIFDEHGNFCLDTVRDLIEDSDYCNWDDEDGESDNELPFRLLINNKYLVFKYINFLLNILILFNLLKINI